jgi:acetoin utilization deacetylase AcuC-like enzyme
MASDRLVAIEDRKLDQATSVQKHNEHMDRLLFRRETAINESEQSSYEKMMYRAMMEDRGIVAVHDKRIDNLLKLVRKEEDRDIMNFRRELSEAKAAKDIADAVEQHSILVSNGLIAQEYRRMDVLLHRARQEENKDILHYRRCGCCSESISESVSYYGT